MTRLDFRKDHTPLNLIKDASVAVFFWRKKDGNYKEILSI